MDVEANVGKGIESLPALTQQQISEVSQPIQQPPVKKGPPKIPMLPMRGLGMSTLIKENGKTQEEMDVEANVGKGI